MTNNKLVSFHVDMDSPATLLRYYGIKNVKFTGDDLNVFYEIAINRVLELFDRYNVKATFFCVGDELESNTNIRKIIKDMYVNGHEIANHTYTHFHGLTKLKEKEIFFEIEKCSDIIEGIIGVRPVGFRAPGYDINNKIIEILEALNFKYDSSGFWSILNPLIKMYNKLKSKDKDVRYCFGENSKLLLSYPYFPSNENWLRKTSYRKIMELPMPRTNILNLPFYSNFHLMAPKFYRKFALKHIKVNYFVYLFHLIEFVDLKDKVPKELSIHPNLQLNKNEKLNIIGNIVSTITKRYLPVRTNEFVNKITQDLIKTDSIV